MQHVNHVGRYLKVLAHVLLYEPSVGMHVGRRVPFTMTVNWIKRHYFVWSSGLQKDNWQQVTISLKIGTI